MNFWLNLSKPAKIIFATILLLAIAFGVYLLFWSKVAITTPQLKDFSKQLRPAPMLPTGKQVYEVIQQDFTYQPKVRFVSLDPVDPKPGEEQRVTVQVDAYSRPVQVNVFGGGDSGMPELALKESTNKILNLERRYFVGEDNNLVSFNGQKIYREEITNKFNRQAGISVTSILGATSSYVGDGPAPTSTTISVDYKEIFGETALKTYEFSGIWKATEKYSAGPSLGISIKEEFKGNIKTSNPTISKLIQERGEKFAFDYAKKNKIPTTIDKEIKDKLYGNTSFSWIAACQTPLGGNWESSEECVISYPDGSDGGNILISQTSRLVSDADIVINPGKSIIFSRDGRMAINYNNSIKESYIWKQASDGDGSKEIISDFRPKGDYFRRYLFNQEDLEFRGLNANGQIYTLPKGRQQYTVSGGDPNAPKIIQVDIDPLDVKPGDTQKMKIVVQSGGVISEVKAKIETDKGYVDVPLAFEGKTADADILPNPYFVNEKNELAIAPISRQSGKLTESSIVKTASAETGDKLTYSGSWVVKDTIAKKYRTTFIVRDSAGKENSITMAWSDPCGTNNSYTDSLYTANCTTNQTQGNARGNLAIGRVSPAANPTITLQSSSRLFVTSGYSISIIGTSKIVLNVGAQIKVGGYASARDQDLDGYAIGSILLADSAPVGYDRNLSTINEGWTDCVDTDANVNPGSSGDTYPGSNGWDWDCDGQITMPGFVFTAGCTGDGGGCPICEYWAYGCQSWSCAYGGMTYGYSPGYCGCDNELIDGCTQVSGGPGLGCDPFDCIGYEPNVIESPSCAVCK